MRGDRPGPLLTSIVLASAETPLVPNLPSKHSILILLSPFIMATVAMTLSTSASVGLLRRNALESLKVSRELEGGGVFRNVRKSGTGEQPIFEQHST